jgi:hypothetical protein
MALAGDSTAANARHGSTARTQARMKLSTAADPSLSGAYGVS